MGLGPTVRRKLMGYLSPEIFSFQGWLQHQSPSYLATINSHLSVKKSERMRSRKYVNHARSRIT